MTAPWSDKKTLENENAMEKLSQEILDFEKYIAPTPIEKLNRDVLLYSVVELINGLYANTVVEPFGSFVTGLQFPSSDIDVNIDFKKEMDKREVVKILNNLRRTACRNDLFRFKDTLIVPHARIPVFTATDDNKVSIDITIQNESPSSDRTVIWLKEYPTLKPLFLVLKQSLSYFRLSSDPNFNAVSAKHCGLASYSLICLIVSFLQLQAKELDPLQPDYFGQVLIRFLDFYSNFDFENQIISLNDGGRYYTEKDVPKTFAYKQGKLMIIDPDIEESNVSRSTSKFSTIKTIFATASSYLKESIQKPTSKSILSSIIKIEEHRGTTVRADGDGFKAKEIWIDSGRSRKSIRHGSRTIPNGTEVPHSRYQRREHHRTPYQRNDSDRPRSSYQRPGTIENYQPQAGYHRHHYHNNNNNRTPYQRPDSDHRYKSNHRQDSTGSDYNQREYERHLKNNRSHLAQHYKRKIH